MLGEGSLGERALGEGPPIRPAITPDGVAMQLRQLLEFLATTTEPVRAHELWQRWHLVLEEAARNLGGPKDERSQSALKALFAEPPEGPDGEYTPRQKNAAQAVGKIRRAGLNKALRKWRNTYGV